jgi:hypothetical protein
MRERAAQELNPEMGRMGAEDTPRGFPAATLCSLRALQPRVPALTAAE